MWPYYPSPHAFSLCFCEQHDKPAWTKLPHLPSRAPRPPRSAPLLSVSLTSEGSDQSLTTKTNTSEEQKHTTHCVVITEQNWDKRRRIICISVQTSMDISGVLFTCWEQRHQSRSQRNTCCKSTCEDYKDPSVVHHSAEKKTVIPPAGLLASSSPN